jgi:hypothetical protein
MLLKGDELGWARSTHRRANKCIQPLRLNPEGRKDTERRTRKLEDNIKMDLKRVGKLWTVFNWLKRERDQWRTRVDRD